MINQRTFNFNANEHTKISLPMFASSLLSEFKVSVSTYERKVAIIEGKHPKMFRITVCHCVLSHNAYDTSFWTLSCAAIDKCKR